MVILLCCEDYVIIRASFITIMSAEIDRLITVVHHMTNQREGLEKELRALLERVEIEQNVVRNLSDFWEVLRKLKEKHEEVQHQVAAALNNINRALEIGEKMDKAEFPGEYAEEE